jgi:hypothetical protein
MRKKTIDHRNATANEKGGPEGPPFAVLAEAET